MKFLLSVIAGLLILALYLFWKVQPPVWIQVETNSSQLKQSVRMAGTTLQVKHMIKSDAGEETAVISNGMTLSVQPVIAVMMLILTWQIGADGIKAIGWVQSIVITGISLLAMTKFKMHPAFLIIAAFLYGGLVIPYL